jgi:hypothetical protein
VEGKGQNDDTTNEKTKGRHNTRKGGSAKGKWDEGRGHAHIYIYIDIYIYIYIDIYIYRYIYVCIHAYGWVCCVKMYRIPNVIHKPSYTKSMSERKGQDMSTRAKDKTDRVKARTGRAGRASKEGRKT